MPARRFSPGLLARTNSTISCWCWAAGKPRSRLNCSTALPLESVFCTLGIVTWLNGTAVARDGHPLLTGAVPIFALGALVALVEPSVFFAVTWTRSVLPVSSFDSVGIPGRIPFGTDHEISLRSAQTGTGTHGRACYESSVATEAQKPVPVKRAIRVAEFRTALREFESRSEQVVRRWGLTPQRYLLLLMIKGAPDGGERATMTELKDRMKVSPNTASDLVSRAEDAGLVVRTPAKHDLRVVHVTLTAEGDRLLSGAMRENEEYRRELARRFEALNTAFQASQRR